METNCAPLLAKLFLYSYKIDDLIVTNNKKFLDYLYQTDISISADCLGS